MGFLLGLLFLTCMLWVGFKLTGALLAACVWLFIQLPIAMIIMALGFVFCCTLLLLPVGIGCMKAGIRILVPGI